MLPETIRTFILGNPILIPTTSTATSFFFDQIVSNYKLMALVALIVSICVFMLVSTYIRHRDEPSTYLIYASGLLLFFTALAMRLMKGPGVGAFLLTDSLLSRIAGIEDKEIHGVISSNIYNAKKTINDVEIYGASRPKEHSLLDLLKPIRFNAIMYHSKSTKDTSKCVSNLKLVMEDKQKGEPNPSVDKDAYDTETKDAASVQSEIKSSDPLELGDAMPSNPPISTQLASDGETGDRFIKSVLHTINAEFAANNSISKYFQEVDRAIDKMNEEARRFDSNLRRFFNMSAKIEKEMKSFNVSVESCNMFRTELLGYVKSIASLKSILENLNYRDGTDIGLNSIFKGSMTHGIVQPSNSPYIGNSSVGNVFYMFLVFQFGLGLFLLYSAVVRSNLIFLTRFIAIACLALDLAVSTLFMAQAHLLDKSCILGRVNGCESNFGTGLADFAASANIDLKTNSSKKLENVSRSLEKIQYRTESTVTVLRALFEESMIAELENRSIYFASLFGKIRFVEDDFNELTHSKVDKSEFFRLVEAMELGLSQINLDLRTVDLKKLLDFYTREVVFLNFVKSEKANILISIENQIEGRKILGSEKTTKCEQKKARLCKEKEISDLVFMTLMAGPVVLMILLLF